MIVIEESLEERPGWLDGKIKCPVPSPPPHGCLKPSSPLPCEDPNSSRPPSSSTLQVDDSAEAGSNVAGVQDLIAGDVHVLKYRVIRPLVGSEAVELI